MDHPLAYTLFTPGTTVHDVDYGPVTFAPREIGRVHLPSGQIVAGDALGPLGTTPLGIRVRPGRYPVTVAIGALPENDERIGAAIVRFRDGVPAEWGFALRDGVDEASVTEDSLGEHEIPVESGTAAFLSAEAAEALLANYTEQVEDAINAAMAEHYQDTRDWADYLLDAQTGLNVVLFSAGLGDGTYPPLVGLDANGDAICLLLDFGIVQTEPPPELADE